MEAGGGRPRSELRRNDVTARRGLPVLSWILPDHSRRAGEPARGAPQEAAGSRQRSSMSKVSIPTRAAAGSRTQSFAVVTRSAPARSASRRSRGNFSRTEPVMIGKRARRDDLGPDPPQAGEKLGRTADAGECRHAHAAEPGCVYRLKAGAQDRPLRRAHRFRRFAVADQNDRVRPRQAGPDRFAQRSGRNEAAIAESVFGVDDEERQVLGDPRVLKPVVEHDDLRRRQPLLRGIRRPGRARPSTARVRASSNASSPTASGVVPHRIDAHRSGEPPAIAARHGMHRDSRFRQ